jgi:hypothetical protein
MPVVGLIPALMLGFDVEFLQNRNARKEMRRSKRAAGVGCVEFFDGNGHFKSSVGGKWRSARGQATKGLQRPQQCGREH